MLRVNRRTAPVSVTGATLFALAQAALLVLALFPLLPGRLHATIGQVASETITSPRDFSYDSDVVRLRLREEAAKNVRDVIAFDVSVSTRQLGQLDAVMAELDGSRQIAAQLRPTPRPAAGGPLVTPAVRTAVLSLTDEQWAATETTAHSVLAEVLHEPFTADAVETQRSSITGRLGASLDPGERDVVVALAGPLVTATESVDSAATQAQRQRAIDAVPPQVRHFAQNQDIVRQGQPIDVGSSRVDLQACKLEYSIVSPK